MGHISEYLGRGRGKSSRVRRALEAFFRGEEVHNVSCERCSACEVWAGGMVGRGTLFGLLNRVLLERVGSSLLGIPGGVYRCGEDVLYSFSLDPHAGLAVCRRARRVREFQAAVESSLGAGMLRKAMFEYDGGALERLPFVVSRQREGGDLGMSAVYVWLVDVEGGLHTVHFAGGVEWSRAVLWDVDTGGSGVVEVHEADGGGVLVVLCADRAVRVYGVGDEWVEAARVLGNVDSVACTVTCLVGVVLGGGEARVYCARRFWRVGLGVRRAWLEWDDLGGTGWGGLLAGYFGSSGVGAVAVKGAHWALAFLRGDGGVVVGRGGEGFVYREEELRERWELEVGAGGELLCGREGRRGKGFVVARGAGGWGVVTGVYRERLDMYGEFCFERGPLSGREAAGVPAGMDVVYLEHADVHAVLYRGGVRVVNVPWDGLRGVVADLEGRRVERVEVESMGGEGIVLVVHGAGSEFWGTLFRSGEFRWLLADMQVGRTWEVHAEGSEVRAWLERIGAYCGSLAVVDRLGHVVCEARACAVHGDGDGDGDGGGRGGDGGCAD